jgi:lambda family phage portal protein
MSILDQALAIVAPGLALRRMQARLATEALSSRVRRYEAASSGRRTAGWRATGSSANAETLAGVPRLRNLARDLERNNPWASKGLTVIVSNVVGTGIRCQPRAASKAKAKRAAHLWEQWAETPACDFDGRHDLYGLQALALQTAARDGEALIRFRRTGAGPVPLQLQVLEPDFLDETKSTIAGAKGNRITQGVETDDLGRVVAYWLHPNHPGDPNGRVGASQRVSADQIARVYRQDRAGQLRGVSWFAPVMMTLRDLDEYEDAQLVRQKVAACYAVFVHDATGVDSTDLDGDGSPLPERVEPGIIEHLPAGKDITFASPPSVEGFSDYVRAVLRKVAAGLGVTYESLTGDLTATSFSGGRMGWIEFHRNIEAWRWRMLIPQFCAPVWRQFIEAASVGGADLTGVAADWTPPRREMVNPKDEIAAARDAIRSGQTSWSETVREWGFDPATLAQELADDAKRFDELGLVLDCDPRKTTQQGQPRDKAAGQEETTP